MATPEAHRDDAPLVQVPQGASRFASPVFGYENAGHQFFFFMRLRPFDCAFGEVDREIVWIADGSPGVLIAHRRPVAFPRLPRLTAHLASAKGFQLSGFDALLYRLGPPAMTDIEPQLSEFLFDLRDFEPFANDWLQVLT
jgi:hypothetical protein